MTQNSRSGSLEMQNLQLIRAAIPQQDSSKNTANLEIPVSLRKSPAVGRESNKNSYNPYKALWAVWRCNFFARQLFVL